MEMSSREQRNNPVCENEESDTDGASYITNCVSGKLKEIDSL